MLFEKSVTPSFANKVKQVCATLGINPDHLMCVMGFETIYTFSPSIQNSIGATGLIQFLPSTAIGLGTTTAQLKTMTGEEQLDYVGLYLARVINQYGPLKSLVDVYLAVFYPAAIPQPLTFAFSPKVSNQNPVFDLDKNGNIIKAEVATTILGRSMQKSIGKGLPTATASSVTLAASIVLFLSIAIKLLM